jgi:hypothetical protein
MKLQKKKKTVEKKNQASPIEPCKPELNSQTCNLLNSRPRLNLKSQHPKNQKLEDEVN